MLVSQVAAYALALDGFPFRPNLKTPREIRGTVGISWEYHALRSVF